MYELAYLGWHVVFIGNNFSHVKYLIWNICIYSRQQSGIVTQHCWCWNNLIRCWFGGMLHNDNWLVIVNVASHWNWTHFLEATLIINHVRSLLKCNLPTCNLKHYSIVNVNTLVKWGETTNNYDNIVVILSIQ